MPEPLRVGVVGCGIGRQHVAAFAEMPDQFRTQTVCDMDRAKAQALADRYHIPHIAANWVDLCRRDDLDVISICTPSYLHYEQTLQALESGKHVISEKPIAGSLKEIDELMIAEAKSGKRVMPIFQYRFGHGVQKLKFLVDQGLAGRAFLTTSETAWRRRPDYYAIWHGRWQKELGGPIVTLGVHSHDIVYYILGPARSVFARTATRVNPIETEACVSASLEMADGSLCSLSVTTGSAEQISRLRFCFSALTAESNVQPYNHTAEPWKFTGDSAELTQKIGAALSQFLPLPERFIGQFSRFYAALQGQADMPVTCSDARASLELITAIYHSAQTGQAVSLPIGQDHPKYAGWRP